MSDFPLLCRVLQDYSSDHHRIRLNSINSNEQLEIIAQECDDSVFSSPSHGASSVLEASTSTATTTDQLHDSHDYDELDSVMKDLQSKTHQAHPYLPDDVSNSSNGEAAKQDGIMGKSQSADKLFDDPKYSHLSVSSECDPLIVRQHPHENLGATIVNGHPAISLHPTLEDKVFDEKQFKEYMSLDQVLDIVNSKTMESQRVLTEADIEMLYSPRVLGPVKDK